LTTLDTGITTPQGVLNAARRLAPAIAARADEIEAGRRLPRATREIRGEGMPIR
jgi:hypothetical protein